MANKDIRDYAKEKAVPLWKIAQRLHINDGNFSRKLRTELSIEEKSKIVSIIDEIVQKNGSEKLPNILDYFNQMNGEQRQLLFASAEQILLNEDLTK